MKVRQLVEMLNQYDEEQEVRFVYQQNYPLQDHISGVWEFRDADGDEEWEDWDEECDGPRPAEKPKHKNEGIVYVVSGGQVYDTPYGHRAAFQEYEKAW